MSDSFHLLDLKSQAHAVQEFLRGQSSAEKLAWIAAHGQLRRREVGSREVYDFQSSIGIGCTFFLDREELVFLGDHSWFTV